MAPMQHTFVRQYVGFRKIELGYECCQHFAVFFLRQNVQIRVWMRTCCRNRKNLPGTQHFDMVQTSFSCPELLVQISGYILGLWNALHQVH